MPLEKGQNLHRAFSREGGCSTFSLVKSIVSFRAQPGQLFTPALFSTNIIPFLEHRIIFKTNF